MLSFIKERIKRKIYSFLERAYSPILKKMDMPINGGALELLLRKEICQENNILSISQTIQAITEKKKILMRLSDGELPILHGKSGGFHSYNKDIKNKLLEAYYFSLYNSDFLMAVNPDLIYPYTNPNDLSLISSCKHYSIMDFLSFFPIDYTYGNALFLRSTPFSFYKECFPNQQNEKFYIKSFDNHFYKDDSMGRIMFSNYKNFLIEPLKQLWKDKHIIVCEGRFSCIGTYNDLFEYAGTVERIHGPNQDAFLEYEKLKSLVFATLEKYPKDNVFVVCALGHTSKILIIDLYQQGYRNILDIGNLSISYDSYLHTFPGEWIDDPVQTISYPPKYYGLSIQEWEKNEKRF